MQSSLRDFCVFRFLLFFTRAVGSIHFVGTDFNPFNKSCVSSFESHRLGAFYLRMPKIIILLENNVADSGCSQRSQFLHENLIFENDFRLISNKNNGKGLFILEQPLLSFIYSYFSIVQ